jgi:ketosteroid isomerase-like protein
VSEENVEVLWRLYRRWERGDFVTPEAFDPEVEFVRTVGSEDAGTSGSWRGVEAMWDALVEWLQAWTDVRYSAEKFIPLGDRVLVLSRQTARGKASGLSSEQRMADIFVFRDGRIVRWEVYWDRSDALKAAGLEA